eukprot:496535-Rhodomonas_salina.2
MGTPNPQKTLKNYLHETKEATRAPRGADRPWALCAMLLETLDRMLLSLMTRCLPPACAATSMPNIPVQYSMADDYAGSRSRPCLSTGSSCLVTGYLVPAQPIPVGEMRRAYRSDIA